ncbi:MAG: hypothetical protein IPP14_12400 [Planctomycetes bacterium]|nr:hypothetical protein [Planctomycetota bacterium]
MPIDDPKLRKIVTVHMIVAANLLVTAATAVGFAANHAEAEFAERGLELSVPVKALLMCRWAGFIALPLLMISALVLLREREPAFAWRLGIAYGVMAVSAGWWLLGTHMLAI